MRDLRRWANPSIDAANMQAGHADGNKHEKIVGNRCEVVQGEDYHFAKDMNLTVLGTLNIKCKNFNIEVEEDYIDEVEGDRKSFIKGHVE